MDNSAKPIPRFFPTIGQLPTSYLMSMTYEEQLTWLCNYINKEIVPIVNANNEAISQIPEFEESVSQKLQVFEEYLQTYEIRLDELEQQIENYNTLINQLNIKVDSNFDELKGLINSNYLILKNYVDSNVYELNNKIDNIQIGQIQVYNPTSGVLSPLQDVINDLYGITNKDGLTATEFDGLDLTATAFDTYQITAYEFDSQGKTILV